MSRITKKAKDEIVPFDAGEEIAALSVEKMTDDELAALRMDGMTIKQRKAIMLLADGVSILKTAETVGVARNTVYCWLENEQFKKARDTVVYSTFSALLGKAVKVLNAQLSSKNEWLQQNAARIVIEKVLPVTQQAGSAMVINFNMPKPAMPPPDQVIDEKDVKEENGQMIIVGGGTVG